MCFLLWCLCSLLAAQLGNLEIGGTKGKVLTTSVAQIHVDFGLAVEIVKDVDYDVMDLDAASAFEDIYQTFRSDFICITVTSWRFGASFAEPLRCYRDP